LNVPHGRRWRVIPALVGAGLLVHVTWMAFGLGGALGTGIVDGLALFAGSGTGAALTYRRARGEADPAARLGWTLLSVICAACPVGMVVAAFSLRGMSVPFPSPSDAVFLTAIALEVPAVLLLCGPMWTTSRLRVVLDGGIVAGAVLLVSWLTVMHEGYRAGGANTFSFVLSLAYPIGDVMTVVMVVSVLSYARRVVPALVAVAAGIVCFAVSDSGFVYIYISKAIYHGASAIDAGWVAGYLLLGFAAVLPRDTRSLRGGVRSRWQLLLPYLLLVGVSLLVPVSLLRHEALDPVSRALLGTLVALVLARQLVALLESRSLTARLKRTVSALERARSRWEEVSAEREILIQQAPVGIGRLDGSARLQDANLALQGMLGYSRDELVGLPVLGLVHHADRDAEAAAYAALGEGRADHLRWEGRFVRKDGSLVWLAQTASALRGPNGRAESLITIVEDVSERRRQAARAAHIQRQLLPQAIPELDGYEVAGACVPAEDVAGDFYDWVQGDGWLDLTLADVADRGVGAALVMAAARTALRLAPPALGPLSRVRLAAQSLAVGMGGDRLLTSLFHARLDLASGVLRYVSLGRGRCAIRRLDGHFVTLAQLSVLTAVRPDEELFREGRAQLAPGETLAVCSDALIESGDRTVDFAELLSLIDRHANPAEIVGRLTEGLPTRLADDVTLLVLRRQP
jgi:PAS domain S-box-containing protein